MSAVVRRLRYSKRALQEIEVARAWWRNNRPKAPDALDEDLDRALRLAREHPEIAAVISSGSGLRRFVLARVRYFLYFRLSKNGKTVFILSLWHTSREQPGL